MLKALSKVQLTNSTVAVGNLFENRDLTYYSRYWGAFGSRVAYLHRVDAVEGPFESRVGYLHITVQLLLGSFQKQSTYA